MFEACYFIVNNKQNKVNIPITSLIKFTENIY